MGEIKFRGKRIDNGEWVHGDLFQKKDGLVAIRRNYHTWAEDPYDLPDPSDDEDYIVYPGTVSQFTGLKDKNGKEIFEGDIVKWYQLNIDGGPDLKITRSRIARMRGVVEYSGERFRIAIPEDGDELPYYPIPGLITLCDRLGRSSEGELQIGSPAYPDNLDEFPDVQMGDLYHAEVIGNKHDNPELLEVKR